MMTRGPFAKDSLASLLDDAESRGSWLLEGSWRTSLDKVVDFAIRALEINEGGCNGLATVAYRPPSLLIVARSYGDDWPEIETYPTSYVVMAFHSLIDSWMNRDCDEAWTDEGDETIARLYIQILENNSPDITGDIP